MESCACMSKTFIRSVEFTAYLAEIHDKQRSGRPSISDETVAKVEQAMSLDRRITLDDICLLVLQVFRSTIYMIEDKDEIHN